MRSRLGQVLRRQFGSLTIFNYRIYFAGQAVSLIGTWMQTTGQAWLVLQLTGSPLALGTVTTLQFLPITCFTLFGGVFADRLPKRRLLVITQSFAMLQAVALNLIAFGTAYGNYHGQAFTIFVLTVAACEAAIALVLFLAIYQQRKTLDVSIWHDLGEIDIRIEEPELTKEAMLADPVPAQDIPLLTPAGLEPKLPVNGEPAADTSRKESTTSA